MEKLDLFSPHDVPGLYDAFGTDSFDDLYVGSERDESIPRKTIKAQTLILGYSKRTCRDWSFVTHEYRPR